MCTIGYKQLQDHLHSHSGTLSIWIVFVKNFYTYYFSDWLQNEHWSKQSPENLILQNFALGKYSPIGLDFWLWKILHLASTKSSLVLNFCRCKISHLVGTKICNMPHLANVKSCMSFYIWPYNISHLASAEFWTFCKILHLLSANICTKFESLWPSGCVSTKCKHDADFVGDCNYVWTSSILYLFL